jgi:hypothetical protein
MIKTFEDSQIECVGCANVVIGMLDPAVGIRLQNHFAVAGEVHKRRSRKVSGNSGQEYSDD